MKNLIFLILQLLIPILICGQSLDTLSGLIKDSSGNPIPGANVWIFLRNDTLHKTSDDYGKVFFSVKNIDKITIKATSLGYNEGRLVIEAGTNNFEIILKDKTNILKEVVVIGTIAPVTLKRDTVEYDVTSFMQSQNDVIQDLLARLPGLEVTPDGSISMMGQKITKIRINDHDFLVSDLRTLTNIIPASLINKIQLIDDYGDESRLTGRRFGEKQKVINLTTTSNIDKIYAGRLMAGKGPSNLYTTYGNVLKYNSKHSITILLSNNNVNRYSDKANNTEGELSYRQLIKKNITINIGVKYNNYSLKGESKTETKSVTKEGFLYNNSELNENNKTKTITIRNEINYKPNEKTQLTINFKDNFRKNDNLSSILNLQTGFQRKDQYANNRSIIQTSELGAAISLSCKFNKIGRVVFMQFGYQKSELGGDLDNNNELKYYINDSIAYSDSTIHQLITNKNTNDQYKFLLSYVEPLNDNSSLQVRYNLFNNRIKSNRINYLMNERGVFLLIDSLSSKYDFGINESQFELNFLHKTKNFEYTIGANIRPYRISIVGRNIGLPFFPVLNIAYQLRNSIFLKVNFNGESLFPTFQQLSDTPDYSDLLNPVYGNSKLKPAWNQNMVLEFIRSQPTQTMFVRFSGNIIRNNIVSNIILTEDIKGSLKQETHYANVNGAYSVEYKNGVSRNFRGNKGSIELDIGGIYSHNVVLYNSNLNYSNSIGMTNKLTINYKYGKCNFSPSISYVLSENFFSIYNNQWTKIQHLNFTSFYSIKFSDNFVTEGSLLKQFNYGFGTTAAQNPFFIDLSIMKWWIKRKMITVLECNNLLNEKYSSTQNTFSNVISIKNTSNRGRFFIFKVIFDLKVI